MHTHILLSALVLCACASPPSVEPADTVPLANYSMGEAERQAQLADMSGKEPDSDAMQIPSTPVRVYWFFGDR